MSKTKIKVIRSSKIDKFEEEVEEFINDERFILDHNPIYSTEVVDKSIVYIAFIKYCVNDLIGKTHTL